jgi:thioredoxin-related protein
MFIFGGVFNSLSFLKMKFLGVVLSIAVSIFCFYSFGSAVNKAERNNAINWLSWEQAIEKYKVSKRKILVDVYTDWCGWCKRMDASTFSQPHLARYINDNFYAVKLNGESKDDIIFNGQTFKFVKQGIRGYHELAAEITRGRLSYPTIVFIDENLEVIQPIPGYKEPNEFEMILTYFGENMHKKTPWDSYQRNYQPLKKN